MREVLAVAHAEHRVALAHAAPEVEHLGAVVEVGLLLAREAVVGEIEDLRSVGGGASRERMRERERERMRERERERERAR